LLILREKFLSLLGFKFGPPVLCDGALSLSRLFENRSLRRMFEPNRDEHGGGEGSTISKQATYRKETFRKI
jgi:hypothetical protein